jgi:hypothetical protein
LFFAWSSALYGSVCDRPNRFLVRTAAGVVYLAVGLHFEWREFLSGVSVASAWQVLSYADFQVLLITQFLYIIFARCVCHCVRHCCCPYLCSLLLPCCMEAASASCRAGERIRTLTPSPRGSTLTSCARLSCSTGCCEHVFDSLHAEGADMGAWSAHCQWAVSRSGALWLHHKHLLHHCIHSLGNCWHARMPGHHCIAVVVSPALCFRCWELNLEG